MNTTSKNFILQARRNHEEVGISGVHAWLVLWKATRSIEAISSRSIGELGLCTSDFGVLEALLHKGPLPVNEIGKRVLLTSGSMTAAIDRLEKKAWVIRKSHPTDHRARMVHLTAAGRKWIEKAFTEHAERMEAAFLSLDNGERSLLVGLLKKLGKSSMDHTK